MLEEGLWLADPYEVKREESRKQLVLGESSTQPMIETTAMMVKSKTTLDSKQKKGAKTWCDHCNKAGHTKEKYWKLHGKPPNWKPRQQKESQGMMVAGENQNEGQFDQK